MTPIFAKIQGVTGVVKHLRGVMGEGGLQIEDLPDPVSVEIIEKDNAYYLLRLDRDGSCISDTWHSTLNEAKEQAKFEFGILVDDWSEPAQGG